MKEPPDNWRTACLHADALRVFAGLGILGGLVLLGLFSLNKHTAAAGGHDLSTAIYPAAFFLITGTGLLFGLRVFAVIFSLPVAAFGAWLVIGSTMHIIETPMMLVNILFGILLMMPAWSTIVAWRALR